MVNAGGLFISSYIRFSVSSFPPRSSFWGTLVGLADLHPPPSRGWSSQCTSQMPLQLDSEQAPAVTVPPEVIQGDSQDFLHSI